MSAEEEATLNPDGTQEPSDGSEGTFGDDKDAPEEDAFVEPPVDRTVLFAVLAVAMAAAFAAILYSVWKKKKEVREPHAQGSMLNVTVTVQKCSAING